VSPKILLIVQSIIGILIIIAVIWYVGAQGLGSTLLSANLTYIGLCLFAYFLMNVLFAIRLVRVLGMMGFEVNFLKTLLIQYGGMLASDFTPARSGYFIVPIMLKEEGIPIQAGLSSILGCQSIEFLVKILGGTLAIAYITSRVHLSQELFILSIIGLALMSFASVLIAAAMWWTKATGFLEYLSKVPLLGRIVSFFLGKISEFQRESEKVKSVIYEILILTLISWVVKGFEWYFIGLALNITQISLFGYFLLHPLITALSFVPLTPSGLGFQEGAIVGVLYLLGVSPEIGLAFAILARVLLILEDLIGVYPISRIGIKALGTVSKNE
jgi:hypothetical protein